MNFFSNKDQSSHKNIKITNCDSKNEAVSLATSKLQQLIDDKVTAGESILLLLSGGSAWALLEKLSTDKFSDRITIGVLDERYSNDEKINNFSQLAQSNFYKNTKTAGANFVDTRVVEGESQSDLAVRFESALKKWRTENPDGKIIITQGIGVDGHTSGIMPFPENPAHFKALFDSENKWVVAYDATGKNDNPLRVTTTLSFLRQVDESVLFVSGEDKKSAVARVFDSNESISAVPARIIFEMKRVCGFVGDFWARIYGGMSIATIQSMKKLKFEPHLCEQILSGNKTSTWRLFDDKDLQVGDTLQLVNRETLEIIGTATITKLRIKALGTLTPEDWVGHEKYPNEEFMYATYRKYYGDRVDENTEVKIISFDFKAK